jgi:hypothetical protein
MAATLTWENSTAATATWGAVTKLRFKAANDNTDDSINPLVRPTSGVNRSFEKACRINVTVAPSSQLSNLRVKLNLAMDTGLTMYYGFTATYTQPVGTDSTVATTTLTTSEVSWTNSGTKTGTGQWGDLFYTQIDVATNAAGGEITDNQFVAVYDEI